MRIAVSLSVDVLDKPVRREKYGITSRYLQDIYTGVKDFSQTRVTNKIFIKDSLFKQPDELAVTPIIMVGPGTGVVPFIGFMQERDHALREKGEDSLAPAHLFFGCRKSDSDYIYKEDIQGYKTSGVIDNLFVALSREPG